MEGDVLAQHQAAVRLIISKDFYLRGLAVGFLKKAAGAGYAPSMALLGALHLIGECDGIELSTALGECLLREAAEMGEATAHSVLGRRYAAGDILQLRPVAALHHLTAAAKTGHAESMWRLGVLLSKGGVGVPKNRILAQGWYEKGAKAGSVEAARNLGWMLLESSDGADKRSAARWFARAAQGDCPDSSLELGRMMLYGNVVPRNYVRGVSLLRRSLLGGRNDALVHLAYAHISGKGAQESEFAGYAMLSLAEAWDANESAEYKKSELERLEKTAKKGSVEIAQQLAAQMADATNPLDALDMFLRVRGKRREWS
jgi:TPR repeat protein